MECLIDGWMDARHSLDGGDLGLLFLLTFSVPVVLCDDDEQVLRTIANKKRRQQGPTTCSTECRPAQNKYARLQWSCGEEKGQLGIS